ncbi:MAG: phosphatase PAP2 family protein [Pseudoxanthomonas sp.]
MGDALLVGPAVLLAVVLLSLQDRAAMRPALAWLACFAAACALVAASKIAFYGWGIGVRAWNLTCFSGHTVLALGAWPVLLALLVPPRHRRGRAAMAVAGIALGLLVGASRVALHAHPPAEVLVGVVPGGLAAAVGLHGLRRRDLAAGKALLLGAGLALLLAWGSQRLLPRLPTEQWFQRVAVELSGREKPHARPRWLQSPPPQARRAPSRKHGEIPESPRHGM